MIYSHAFTSLLLYNGRKSGFATLVSLLVAGAVGTAIVLSLLSFGIANSKTSMAIERSSAARGFANACAEEALAKIRESPSSPGTGTLSFPLGTCSYAITVGVGQARTVDAFGTYGTVVRKVRISVVSENPRIVIDSWKEIP